MILVDVRGHLVSDDNLQELHAFAEALGLERRWFQRRKHLHYDLICRRTHKPNSRLITEALKMGAVLVDVREIVKRATRRECPESTSDRTLRPLIPVANNFYLHKPRQVPEIRLPGSVPPRLIGKE